MMYCHNCGNQLTNDSVFCPRCGTRQNAIQASLSTTLRKQSNNTPERLGTLTLWCVLALLICWPAAIYGWIQRGKALKAATAEEANTIVAATIKGLQIWCGIVVGLLILLALMGA